MYTRLYTESQPRREPASEHTIGIMIARMNALTFDGLPRPSRLRPLILVNIRYKTSIGIPCLPPSTRLLYGRIDPTYTGARSLR
ncbi:hypothetical protein BDR04DRAFT_1106992 [Suillus decipiens]|nr:hypothetical protein BDR04DRAFT_1106992 [Suillus decipiens]